MIIADRDDFLKKLNDISDSLSNISGRLIDEINNDPDYDEKAINDWRKISILENRIWFIPNSIPDILDAYIEVNATTQSFINYKLLLDGCIEDIKSEKDSIEMLDNINLSQMGISIVRDHLDMDLSNILYYIKQIYNSKLTDLNGLIKWVESVSFYDHRCVNIQKRVYEFLLAAKDYMDNEVSKIANK